MTHRMIQKYALIPVSETDTISVEAVHFDAFGVDHYHSKWSGKQIEYRYLAVEWEDVPMLPPIDLAALKQKVSPKPETQPSETPEAYLETREDVGDLDLRCSMEREDFER